MTRKLTIKKEALVELTTDQLADVFAGTGGRVTWTNCAACDYIPTRRCS